MSGSFLVGTVARFLISLAILVVLPGDSGSASPSEVLDSDKPLTISASTIGRFREGCSWYLSVNSAGQAQVTLESVANRRRRNIIISVEQLGSFRKALLEVRFFELAGEYGEVVPDGSIQTLAVTLGDRTKSVRIYYLMNWVANDRAKLHEPSRAVRLLMMVRDWIKDAEAVDLRPYDQKVLDAVGG
jgi:hypothetical protein